MCNENYNEKSFLKTEYYPTPKEIVLKMLEGIDHLSSKTILEPSAGTGSILDVVEKVCREQAYWSGYNYKDDWDCIEISRELQAVLKEKGYRVIDYDFLKFHSEKNYDLILMNPPFSVGVKHLLHAIKISNGAEIRCLLNVKNIVNSNTKERQLLMDMILDLGGEILELGNCFKDADRFTNVEVVLIKIPYREQKSKFEFKISDTEKESYKFEDLNNTQLAKSDVIESLVDRYTVAKKIFGEFLQKKMELEFYIKGLIYQGSTIDDLLKNSFSGNCDKYYEQFIINLKKECWKNILYKTKISDIVTESVRKDFSKFIEQQSNIAFNKDNIEDLFYMLMDNQKVIIEQCILNAFDHMTKYHKENRIHIEGWKNVDSFFVNKKVILPDIVSIGYNGQPKFRYYSNSEIEDIEKAMCFVSGKTYTNIKNNTVTAKIRDEKLSFGEWYESEFFRFKVFKKGTIHLEFMSDFLHNEFNLTACKGKNWLPSDIGRTTVKHKRKSEKVA